ncbi:hypothetical protein LPW11_04060 [Geomonas sp. RF6]|uniref:hypothetical protein n=1 Tax=Geomonas sp. RF6 TaxID=2897342 RepID=UPI001E4A00E5|nr:hypothetical protein [Geomonas sp. RF6]UFS71373.1 hypothetical protein LPW11_04060 [Geomonas sp. RF6]
MNVRLASRRTLFQVLAMILCSGSPALSTDTSEPRIVTWDLGTYYNGCAGTAKLDNGARFVTAGGDRVIRIHNSATGKVERTITAYADNGDGGDFWSITASPDGKQIIAGVNFGGVGEIIVDRLLHKDKATVGAAVFDRESGKLLRQLDGHRMPASRAFFTRDNRYLITASQEVLAWDQGTVAGNGEPKVVIPSLSKEVRESRLIWAAPAGNNTQSRILMSLIDNRQTINLLEIPTGRYLASTRLPSKAVNVETTEDRVAFALEQGGIFLVDADLRQVATLAPDTKFFDVSFSPDAQHILACVGEKPYGCFAGRRSAGYALDPSKVTIATKEPVRASFLSAQRVLLVSADGEMHIHDLASGKDEVDIIPRAPVYMGAGFSGSSVVLGSDTTECSRAVDLVTGGVSKCSSGQIIGAALPSTWKEYRLKRVSNSKGETVYAVAKGDTVSAVLDTVNEETDAGFLDSGLVASKYLDGVILITTLSGRNVASMQGHVGTVVSMRQRGDLLITTGSDHTIRFWDISPLRNSQLKPFRIRIENVLLASDAARAGLQAGWEIASVNGKGFASIADFRDMIAMPGTYTFQVAKKKGGHTDDVAFSKSRATLGIELAASGELDPTFHLIKIYPLASLIVTNDAEWALWSEKKDQQVNDTRPLRTACYAASSQAHNILSWRMNQGNGKESILVPFDRVKEYDAALPKQVAQYLRELASPSTADLKPARFERAGQELIDRKSELVWLRDARAIIGTPIGGMARSLQAVNAETPAGHDDWRYPTEAEARDFFAAIDGEKRRVGSFLEESRIDVLRRFGFLGSDLFKAIALQSPAGSAWSLKTNSPFVPGEKEYLDVLLVRRGE